MWDEFEPGWATDPDLSQAEQVVLGQDPDFMPVVSDRPPSSGDSPFSTFKQIMSGIGSVAQAARDIGSAVGTVERDIKGASREYQTARTNARNGNSIGQFWQYSTPTDKAMMFLAAAGLAVAVYVAVKG